MTREEAIEYFKFHRKIFCEDHLKFCPKDSIAYQATLKEKEFYDMAIKALEQESCDDKGEISDGYHTFNQLYHQRAILFATIVNQNMDIAWKSYKHSDGKYCFDRNGEWFIVGIDTPQGSYTYHYSKEYWDYFKCKELDCGKEWDGHTEEDVTRLLSLAQEPCSNAISREDALEIIAKTDITNGMKPVFTGKQVQALLNDLPSVQPAGRWIPVSERLPEKGGAYLVTTEWKGSYSGDVYTETNMAVYREKEKEWDCAGVIAWMPLPEPYAPTN